MAKAPTKAAKKPAATKSQSRPKAEPVEVGSSIRRDETVSIRQIENGFIVRQSWVEGKGEKSKYMERETFTKTKPTIKIPR